jgi:hypothetical protein
MHRSHFFLSMADQNPLIAIEPTADDSKNNSGMESDVPDTFSSATMAAINMVDN